MRRAFVAAAVLAPVAGLLFHACGREEPAPVVISQIPLVAPGQQPTRPPPPTRRVPVRATISFVTLGTFPAPLADAIEQELRRTLQVDVRRHAPSPLPQSAFYPARRRYRAERLLAYLGTLAQGEPPSVRMLGMTDVDISTTKGRVQDWGIFGLGDLAGRSAVISTFRLRPGSRDDAHFRFRVVTTAVHEIGHTLGLEHCVEPQCLMRDAEGSIEAIDTSTGLGPNCRARLDREAPAVIMAEVPVAPEEPRRITP